VLGSGRRPPLRTTDGSGYPSLVEFIVGALAALGFLAIVARFIARDASGEVRLPRIVDDSIGMWALRRLSGRRLGMQHEDDALDDRLVIDPNAADATRAALGAVVAANAARPADPAHMVSPTPVLDLRRRQQSKTGRRRGSWPRRVAVLGSVAAVLIVAVVVGAAVGAMDGPSRLQGGVLGVTGHPEPTSTGQAERASARPSISASAAAPAKPTPTLSR
jgi:hypothetical protein